MDVTKAIAERRSVKRFADEPVPRETIEMLLRAAVQAPNHRRSGAYRPDLDRHQSAASASTRSRLWLLPMATSTSPARIFSSAWGGTMTRAPRRTASTVTP